MDPVFNEYKAVTYICQYISKSEDQFLRVMKQAAKEAFQSSMHHHETIKKIAKDYLSSPEYFVQEAVYHILPELMQRRIFLSG